MAAALVYRHSLRAHAFDGAQSEVARWEERWEAARACLIGKVAHSAKTREALAIHEMSPDPWEPAKCTKLVAALTRGPAPDSGIDAVEAAWRTLDKAATDAARAYVLHISPQNTFADDPLPAALDSLDEARTKLRAAASLPALTETAVSLRAVQVVPIELDMQPMTELEVDSLPSARGIVLFGQAGTHDVQAILTTGATPVVAEVGDGALRSVPDLSWGALVEEQRVRAGMFDPKGLLRTDFDGRGVFETKGAALVPLVIGAHALGTLAVVDDDKLILAHVANESLERAAPIALAKASDTITPIVSAADVDGRAALVWTSPVGDVGARVMRPGDDGAAIDVYDMPTGPFCLTAREAWAKTPNGVMRFGGDRFVDNTDSEIGDLVGCGVEAALFRDERDPRRFFVCGPTCSNVDIPAGAPRAPALALVGHELVAIMSHSAVLGVWRAGAQPTFYSLPARALPVTAFDMTAMAMSDGTVIDMVVRMRNEYVVLRVPVR
ncbi:MAG TPA: hypothetical protein VMZ53_02505 [Kofleriaceae bacterium]|nr:hypothetical protein [Kofleriaceae bacterium]